jgi:hypothetical protein
MDNKYQQGKIYKIVAYETNEIYIGSTIQSLNARYSRHKSDFKVWVNTKKKYCSSAKMFQAHGLDNCKIVLLENFPCENKKMLEAREGWYMDEYDCVNNRKAGRTKAEYDIKYRKELNAYANQYRKANKEKIKTHKAQYYKDNKKKLLEKHNCVCGGKFTLAHKAVHSETNKHQKYIEQLNP